MTTRVAPSWKLIITTTLAVLILTASCTVRVVPIQRGEAYLKAKTLAYPEICTWFQGLTNQHNTFIIKSASLSFSAESDKLLKKEKFPSAPGVLILARNGDVRLQIYAPVIQTTLVDIISKEGRFAMWYPRKNTLYKGSTEQDLTNVSLAVSDDAKAPRYNLSKLRPMHLTQTFFHSRLSSESTLAVIQEATSDERYYVIHEILTGKSPSDPSRILQSIYLERYTQQIRRKLLFDENGQAICDINYGKLLLKGFPEEIRMKRPVEGYEIFFRIKKMDLDVPLTAEMLDLRVPSDALVKTIGEK